MSTNNDGSLIGDVSACIIAGGKSRRFGSDKMLYEYEGVPLIERVYRIVSGVFRDIAIVGDGGERFAFLNAPCIPDIVHGAGPMGGVYTALTHSQTARCFVVAGDMPNLNGELMRYLVSVSEGCMVTAPKLGWRYETLHAVYSKQCIPLIEERLRQGMMSLGAFIESTNPRAVTEEEISRIADPSAVFRNINYREDAGR